MMATKNKSARLESEIEKGRVEGNWDKVVELLKQITNKTPGLGMCIYSINSYHCTLHSTRLEIAGPGASILNYGKNCMYSSYIN